LTVDVLFLAGQVGYNLLLVRACVDSVTVGLALADCVSAFAALRTPIPVCSCKQTICAPLSRLRTPRDYALEAHTSNGLDVSSAVTLVRADAASPD
jgi:hypothetical protein